MLCIYAHSFMVVRFDFQHVTLCIASSVMSIDGCRYLCHEPFNVDLSLNAMSAMKARVSYLVLIRTVVWGRDRSILFLYVLLDVMYAKSNYLSRRYIDRCSNMCVKSSRTWNHYYIIMQENSLIIFWKDILF